MTPRDPPYRRNIAPMPTPRDLAHAPELAILSALDWILDLVVRALVCEHPELADPERPYWIRPPSPMATPAETLAQQTNDLKQALRDYREAVDTQRQDKPSEHPDAPPF